MVFFLRQSEMSETANSQPLKTKLHQAVRRLKTVRHYCSDIVTTEQVDVNGCLDSVNQLLDGLCQQLESLQIHEESGHPATEGVGVQPESATPADDRDHPSRLSPQEHQDSAPSLEAILARLRKPSDTDCAISQGPCFKSLSDEDLLGLEMLSLSDGQSSPKAPCLPGIPEAIPALQTTPDHPPEAAITPGERGPQPQPETAFPPVAGIDPVDQPSATAVETASAASGDPVVTIVLQDLPQPLLPTESPETVAGSSLESAADQSESVSASNEGASGKRNFAESVYESAHNGQSALFSIEPVAEKSDDSTPLVDIQASSVPSQPLTEWPVAPDSAIAGYDREIVQAAAASDQNGQDEFVRNTIEETNMEKLELLRAQLQRVLASKEIQPASEPAEQLSLNATSFEDQLVGNCGSDLSADPQATTETGTTLMKFVQHSPAAPEVVPPELPQTENNQLTSPDLSNSGDSMSVTAEKAPSSSPRSPLSGFASAAFLKDLHLEEDAENNQHSHHPQAAHQPASPSSQHPPAAAPRCQTEDDVQDYMHQLMTRLRGGAAGPAPAAATRPAAPVAKPVSATPVPTTADSQPVYLEPLREEDFLPKSQAPEKSVNINALRELANQHTRGAVDVFQANARKSMHAAQLVAAAGGLIGSIVFGLLGSSLGTMFYVMSGICLAGAGFAGYRYATENLMKKGRKPARQPNS